MITHGIDLAAGPKDTWLAKIQWDDGAADLLDVHRKVTDEEIIEAVLTTVENPASCDVD